jgi:hypothetical protein
VPAGHAQLAHATLTSTAGAGEARGEAQTAIRPLVEQRARLEAHVAALRAEASRLEAEANALDGE